MKKPYSNESWDRFEELMQKTTKRLAVTETRSALNEEKIETINDFTTGINLLRGTRDFTKGTSLIGNNRYSDGFHIGSGFETYVDEEGFTVLRPKSATSSYGIETYSSLIGGIKTDMTYTCSVELRSSDITSVKAANPFVVHYADQTGKAIGKYNLYVLDKAKVNDEWTRVKIIFTCKGESDHLYVTLQCNTTDPIEYRKLIFEIGSINHPIWSASPFDYSASSGGTAEVPDLTEVKNSIKAIEDGAPLYLGKIPELTNGKDLNTYVEPGTYGISYTAANNGNYPNLPIKDGGRFIVERPNGINLNYVRQRFIVALETSIEYMRYSTDTGSTWSEWRQTVNNKSLIPVSQGGTGANNPIEAKKNLNIQDYTTGINLIRASRTFKAGTEKYTNSAYFTDGFTFQSLNETTTYKNDEGFTVLRMAQSTSGNARTTCTSIYPIKVNDTVTFSSYIMVEDASEYDDQEVLTIAFKNSTHNTIQSVGRKLSQLIGETTIESGKWYHVSFPAFCNNDSVVYFIGVLRLGGKGAVNFYAPAINSGSIDNPIWSPAPADLALEPINDITTENNLIRGTRDLKIGTEQVGNSIPSRNDGFFINGTTSAFTFSKNDEGFGVVTISNSGLSANAYCHFRFSPVRNLIQGDYITIFFDFMVEDVSALDVKTLMMIDYYSTSGVRTLKKDVTLNLLGLPNIESGKWYQGVYHYLIDFDLDGGMLIISNALYRNGTVSYCKQGVYNGYIENPVWSQSPFDVALLSNDPNYIDLPLSVFQGGTGAVNPTEAKKNLEIQDYTTGINLLRGTRDFTIGTQSVFNNYAYSDGFKITAGNANVIRTIDPSGFTVLNLTNATASTTTLVTSAIAGATPGEKITFSVVAKKTGSVTGNVFYIQCYSKSSTLLLDKATNASVLTDSFNVIEDTITVPAETEFVRAVLMNATVGTVSFMQVAAYRGEINHPVWSASPFDVDYINDITSGINLVRGTHDFKTGVERVDGFTNGWVDGFVNPSYTIVKGDDGFAVASSTSQSTSGRYLKSSFVTEPLLKGEFVTASFEVMIDGTPANEIENLAVINENINNTNPNLKVITFSEVGIDRNILEPGKWVKVVVHYQLTKDFDGKTNMLSISLISQALSNDVSTTINFRKLCVYKGLINHPIWSPAPADLVLGSVNDLTTGINLLRGTRDFTKGQNIIPGTADNRYIDGIRILYSNVVNFSKDDEGFTVLNINQPNNTDAPVDFYVDKPSLNEYYTASVEVMIDDVTDSNINKPFISLFVNKYDATNLKLMGHNLPGLGIQNPESKKWYSVSFPIFLESVDSDNWYLGFRLLANSASINFRKPCLYKGKIEHPIWSASPFDVASSKVETSVPLYLGDLPKENVITTSTDLDLMQKPGTYVVTGNAIANACEHLPGGYNKGTFKLIVSLKRPEGTSSGCIDQRLESYNDGAAWTRFRYDSGNGNYIFSPWRYVQNANGIIPIEGGGTNSSTVEDAQKNLYVYSAKGKLQDLDDGLRGINFWDNTSTNIPSDADLYGLVQTFSNSTDPKLNTSGYWLYQLGFTASNTKTCNIYVRSSVNNSGGFKDWKRLAYVDERPYNSGLYAPESIAKKFSVEIGDTDIATWLSERVKAGNFAGLNIGDYVDIDCSGITRRYMIAAIDPYYNCGNPKMGHHIAMIPNGGWPLDASKDGEYFVSSNKGIHWNTERTNNGTAAETNPYMASNLHKWETEVAVKQFPQEWQDAMIDRYAYCGVRYSANSQLTEDTGYKWCNFGKLWSLSEFEVYGSAGRASSAEKGIDCQFPIFNMTSFFTTHNSERSFWLRNVVNGSNVNVCILGYNGINSENEANYSVPPYPCFLIG